MVKKYAVNTKKGEVTSVEVDGQIYSRVDDIPDLKDREMVAHMIPDENEPDTDEDLEMEIREEHNKALRPQKSFIWLIPAMLAVAAGLAFMCL